MVLRWMSKGTGPILLITCRPFSKTEELVQTSHVPRPTWPDELARDRKPVDATGLGGVERELLGGGVQALCRLLRAEGAVDLRRDVVAARRQVRSGRDREGGLGSTRKRKWFHHFGQEESPCRFSSDSETQRLGNSHGLVRCFPPQALNQLTAKNTSYQVLPTDAKVLPSRVERIAATSLPWEFLRGQGSMTSVSPVDSPFDSPPRVLMSRSSRD